MLSKYLFVLLAVLFFKAIGPIKDVLKIYSALSDPSTDIISNVTNERCGATSCFGNGLSEDSPKISSPRVKITGDFVELSGIDVLSPCSGIF